MRHFLLRSVGLLGKASISGGGRKSKNLSTPSRKPFPTILLAYYDTKLPTALFTDASPVGVNTTLAQLDAEGRYKPALTATEMQYDQLEREAVAMHFGCTRFKIFLQGCHFTHFIDPEPLKHMMEKSKREAPAHIERIWLKLQGYNSTIKLVKGKHNPADYLSQHPLPYSTCSKAERETFADVPNHLFVVAQMLPEALTVTRVHNALPNDPVLSQVVWHLTAGVKTCPTADRALTVRSFCGTLINLVVSMTPGRHDPGTSSIHTNDVGLTSM